jgi:hypothetical protein
LEHGEHLAGIGWSRIKSVVFESDSPFEWIKECAFRQSGLNSIMIRSSVIVLGKSSFLGVPLTSTCDI